MSGLLALASFGHKLCAWRLELTRVIGWRGLRMVTHLRISFQSPATLIPISWDHPRCYRPPQLSRISGGPIVPMRELESYVAFQSSF